MEVGETEEVYLRAYDNVGDARASLFVRRVQRPKKRPMLHCTTKHMGRIALAR